MTLQKILLQLSYINQFSVECFVLNGTCTIRLKDWYNQNIIKEFIVNLDEKIDKEQFYPYIK